MSNISSVPTADKAAEWAVRRDLAAAYRLLAQLGWDDLIATHLSARVPGEEAFLINPFGMFFEEVTPASLVKVDIDGNVLEPTDWQVNRAGFVVHSAIHAARPDAGCVMHLHTKDGVAVSCTKEGLLPLNQSSMLLSQDIAFHDFEGVVVELGERERLAANLGTKNLMFLRNHGTLGIAPTIADCFASMYFLEWTCSVQVRTLAMGLAISEVDPAIVAKVASFRTGDGSAMARDLLWPALLRRLDRNCPGWDA
jgi:ribulose-5-phosphate 4-epimerase/fuculose-1-phosphate aldolase